MVIQSAVRESFFGNQAMAKKLALQREGEPQNPDQKAYRALALALSGEGDHPIRCSTKWQKSPAGEHLCAIRLGPTIRAAVALQKKDPITAIEELRPAEPFDWQT